MSVFVNLKQVCALPNAGDPACPEAGPWTDTVRSGQVGNSVEWITVRSLTGRLTDAFSVYLSSISQRETHVDYPPDFEFRVRAGVDDALEVVASGTYRASDWSTTGLVVAIRGLLANAWTFEIRFLGGGDRYVYAAGAATENYYSGSAVSVTHVEEVEFTFKTAIAWSGGVPQHETSYGTQVLDAEPTAAEEIFSQTLTGNYALSSAYDVASAESATLWVSVTGNSATSAPRYYVQLSNDGGSTWFFDPATDGTLTAASVITAGGLSVPMYRVGRRPMEVELAAPGGAGDTYRIRDTLDVRDATHIRVAVVEYGDAGNPCDVVVSVTSR